MPSATKASMPELNLTCGPASRQTPKRTTLQAQMQLVRACGTK